MPNTRAHPAPLAAKGQWPTDMAARAARVMAADSAREEASRALAAERAAKKKEERLRQKQQKQLTLSQTQQRRPQQAPPPQEPLPPPPPPQPQQPQRKARRLTVRQRALQDDREAEIAASARLAELAARGIPTRPIFTSKTGGGGWPQVTPELRKRWEAFLRAATNEDILEWQAMNWRKNEGIQAWKNGVEVPLEDDEDEEPLGDWDTLDDDDQVFWQMTMLGRHFPMELTIKGSLRIDSGLFWTSEPIKVFTLDDLDLESLLEVDFTTHYRRALQNHPNLRIIQRLATVVTKHKGCKPDTIVLDDFGYTQSQRILQECSDQWYSFLKPIEVRIDFKTSTKPATSATPATQNAKKRPLADITILSSDDVEPTTDVTVSSQRRTRTTTLLERGEAQEEERQARGNYGRDIGLRWRCDGDWCSNINGLCWKDNKAQHYAITAIQQKNWASAIAAKKNSVEEPPSSLIQHWIQVEGPVMPTARYPERKQKKDEEKERRSEMAELVPIIKQVMQMKMQTQAMDMIGSIGPSNNNQSSTHHSYIHHQAPSFAPQQQQQLPSQQQQPITDRQVQELPNVSPLPLPPHVKRTDRSSPIDPDAEMEDVVSSFFEWLIDKTKRGETKVKIQTAYQTGTEEVWSLEDLALMNDMTHPMYALATRSGIASGIARSFKEQIRSYKQVYRKQAEATKDNS